MQAASAVELIMEAGFMFDNVADEQEEKDCALTPAEELALAITLLGCGAAVAQEAAYKSERQGHALESVLQIHINCIAACGGQFLDAFLQRSEGATTDDSLRMTYLKSGSLGKLAAEFGASIACDDEETIRGFGEFGFNLFTYMQLVDDLRDALPADGPAMDLMQGKKTLPLVFFRNRMAEAHSAADDGIMRDNRREASADFRCQFEASGAKIFCAIVAETYLNRAKSNLTSLRYKLTTVERLERLVGTLEINPQEVLAAL